MSFLNVLMPIETISGLVQDICNQLEAGRLEYTTGFLGDVNKPTPELQRLVKILAEQLNVRIPQYLCQ
jgi:hypothetical protein